MGYSSHFIKGLEVPLPTLGERWNGSAFGNGKVIDHTRFSLVFNSKRGFAIYTAHNIDGSTVIPKGVIPRKDQFRLDPAVPSKYQVDKERGYSNNPWDQGHLVRRSALHWGDHDEAKQADSESFFWTNIAPQHKELHASAWGKIERWIFKYTDASDRQAAVFTGPVFTPDDPEHKNHSGEDPIRIPAGFWKILAIKRQLTLSAAGFLVWQRDFDRAIPVQFDPVLEQVRITTIEYLVGLSFGKLREADPLRYGTEVVEIAGMTIPQPETARGRGTIITSADDIIL